MPDPRAAAAPGPDGTEGKRESDDRTSNHLQDSAESVAVGALIQAVHGLQVAALDMFADDDFQDRLCRFTVRTVRQMVAQQVPVEPVSLFQYVTRHGLLRDAGIRTAYSVWIADRTTVTAVPMPANLPWYCMAVVENSSRRRITEAAENVVRVADSGSVADLASIVTTATKLMAAAVTRLRAVSA